MEENLMTEKNLDLAERIRETFDCRRQDIRSYSPLALAFVGDGVYELIIRTVEALKGNRSSESLHHDTVRYVKADAQARIAEVIQEKLTEDERSVYRRGRNAKPHTTPKGAVPSDYKKATGLEALLGYLYLTGRMDRALELTRAGIDCLEERP